MKKIIALFFVVLIAFSFTGCKRETLEKFDPTKTQLYIGNFNTGFGDAWIYAAKKRFEAFYADTSFEEGKKGVQIYVSNIPAGNAFIDTTERYDQEIFITENVDYYAFVHKKKLYNMSPAVTGSLSDYGEDSTIEKKMNDVQKNFFKTEDGNYYGVPFYESTYGIVYNVDLFERKSFYFAKGGAPSEYQRSENPLSGTWNDNMYAFTGKGEKSAGPDGKYGTYDDGNPATYQEFFVLCGRMIERNVQPITWTGKFQSYINKLMMSMITDYEGAEQMMLNYNFNGNATDLVSSVNEDGTLVYDTKPTAITSANGYELYRQPGRYYVYKFFEQLIKNSNYYSENQCFNNSQDHKSAQSDFIYGGYSDTKKEIGMLIDGEWWLNEAKPTFTAMIAKFGDDASQSNRKFAMLGLPKATMDKVGEPFTFYDSNFAVIMMNARIDSKKVDLAYKFIKFIHTNDSLLEFTDITSTYKPYVYNITDEYKNSLNYFAKNIFEIHESAVKIYPISKNNLYINQAFNLFVSEEILTSIHNGITYNMPSYAIRNSNLSSVDYFKGVIKYHNQEYWNTKYDSWF